MEQMVRQLSMGSNILDLCFINGGDIIDRVNVTPTTHSDQNIIEFTMYGPKQTAEICPIRTHGISNLEFNKANWKSIRKRIHDKNWPIQDNTRQ